MRRLYILIMALAFSVAGWAQDANVQIIHNSPTPGTNTGPTVDIYVNGNLLAPLTGVEFRQATAFLPVSAGVDIEVAVAPSPSNSVDDAVGTFNLGQLEAGENYTVIATGILGDMQRPFNLAVNAGAQQSAAMAGMVDLNVYHGSTNAPAVDVDARTVGTLVENLAYGNFTDGYLSVEPDVYYLDVRPAGNPTIVSTFEADLQGLGGGAATVFASGLLNSTPGFGLFAALPDGTVVELPATEVARLQVIHNSPSPTVDVYVNGDTLLQDFDFRDATEFLTVPAGVELNIGIAAGDSESVDDTLANFPVTLVNGETYVATAGGVVGDMNTPFELQINASAQESATNDGEVSFAALHGSPDAPNVDIGIRTVGNVITDLEFGEYSGYLDVAPGLYYVDVRAAGNPDIVATFEADLNGLADQAATVFASGFLGDDPGFGLFAALPDGTVVELPATEVARLQVIHNSPSPTVDVYVNGDTLLQDFEFRDATEFLTVPAGVELNIGIAAGDSESVDDTLANFPVTLVNGETYVATAGGVVGDMNTPFELQINASAQESATNAGEVSFAVLHGSPDAPNVDIGIRTFGNIITDLPFGAYSSYVNAAPGLYYIDVRAAGNPDIVATFEADLSGLADLATTVFASGFLGQDPGFGLFAALPDGTVVELPATEVARVQIIHNSPSGTVDLYANGALLEDDFEFRTATPFQTLPAGTTIDIAVAPGNSSSADDAIANFDVTFDNGESYTVIANGIVGDMDSPFNLAVRAGARESSTEMDEVQVVAFHGSPGAPNVSINDFGAAPIISDLAYNDFTSDYLPLPPEAFNFEVRPQGGGPNDVVATFNATLGDFAGNAGVLIASGIVGGGEEDPTFDLLLVLPDGTVESFLPVALVNIIHNSPADAASSIDLWFGDLFPFAQALDYQASTGLIVLPTRLALPVGIAPANSQSSDDILFFADQQPVLEDGRYHVIIANGIPGDAETPFELVVNSSTNLFSETQDAVEVTAFHGSQDAPAVDIVARDLGVDLIEGLDYGAFSTTLPIGSDTYYLEVYPEGSEDLVATFETEIPAELEGFSAVAVASGLLAGDPDFDLLLFSPLVEGNLRAVPVAQVQVIHNSPSPTVDIYANDAELLPDFAFRTATSFLDLPTRVDLDLDVAPGNSSSSADAIATFEDVRFEDGTKYIVTATGIVGDMDAPFGLDIFDMAQTEAAGDGVDLLFYHGSPDAPTVDVLVDADGSILYDDASYGDYQGYVNVPAAAYQLNVTPGDDNATVVKAYDADLSGLEGGAATVFASGLFAEDMGDEAFGVWVALPDGTTFPLSEVVSTNEVGEKFSAFQVAPNPVRETAQAQFTITESLNMVEEIRGRDGKLIRSSAIGVQPAGEHTRNIDVAQLPAGLYTYNLVTDLGVITQRFVVVK